MKCIHIITPVKDSIELTLQTVEAIMASGFQTPFTYTVYNDFSTEENTVRLKEASEKLGFEFGESCRNYGSSITELFVGSANGSTTCH